MGERSRHVWSYVAEVASEGGKTLYAWLGVAGVIFGTSLVGLRDVPWFVPAAVIAIGVLVAQFKAWQRERRDADQARATVAHYEQLPVKPEHRQQLRRMLDRIASALDGDATTQLSEPEAAAVASHFPEIADASELWNGRLPLVSAAQDAFKARQRDEWGAVCDGSKFFLNNIIERCVVEGLDAGRLHQRSQAAPAIVYEDMSDRGVIMWKHDISSGGWSSSPIIRTDDEPDDAELAARKEAVEAYFQTIWECGEVTALVEAEEARAEAKAVVRAHIASAILPPDYYGTCALCLPPVKH